jgi:uncharacterized membrane protein
LDRWSVDYATSHLWTVVVFKDGWWVMSAGSLIGMVVAAFIGIFLCVFIWGSIGTELENMDNESLNETLGTFQNNSWFNLLPLVIIVGAFLFIVSWGVRLEDDGEEDVEVVEAENYIEEERETRKTAMFILRERFANGEITKEEYTERMSRL